LYHRLAVVTLDLPALRDHSDDIPILAETFLRESGYDGPIDDVLPPENMRALEAYRWPGNVRELRNVIEATVAMGEAPALPETISANADTATKGQDPIGALLGRPYKEARATLLREFESRYVADLMERVQGNVARGAREAGIDRTHLTDLVQRHKQST
jgi:DNA-binding NtrC family response regulator